MNKTYKYTLPKGMEVEKTNVRVENGQILVDVELKETFEPKDGDFIYYKSSYSYAIFICKDDAMDKKILGCYAALQLVVDTEPLWNLSSEKYAEKRMCRFATPEEKSAFIERLETELSKRWNPETKQLEDIRWEPKEGESYFFVNSYGGISNTIRNTACDSFIVGIGNAFKTEEAAKPYADQIKEIFKNSKTE